MFDLSLTTLISGASLASPSRWPSPARIAGRSGMQCPRCQQENPPHARFCLRRGPRSRSRCSVAN